MLRKIRASETTIRKGSKSKYDRDSIVKEKLDYLDAPNPQLTTKQPRVLDF